MNQLCLHEIRVSTGSEPPLVILKEVGGERLVPIWTSFEGAAAVAAIAQGDEPETPSMLDVFCEALTVARLELTAVQLTSYQKGRFFAKIMVGDQEIAIRPTDAIALAIREGMTLSCPESLLREVGVLAEPAKEVERFREFLESVAPEDFDAQ